MLYELLIVISVDRNELLNLLSHGEKRTMYPLDVLSEAEARRQDNTFTLVAIDDYADSIDYKSKALLPLV